MIVYSQKWSTTLNAYIKQRLYIPHYHKDNILIIQDLEHVAEEHCPKPGVNQIINLLGIGSSAFCNLVFSITLNSPNAF